MKKKLFLTKKNGLVPTVIAFWLEKSLLQFTAAFGILHNMTCCRMSLNGRKITGYFFSFMLTNGRVIVKPQGLALFPDSSFSM